ncbi:hypothetical protein [Candidatus Acidianus copahuensis]|uniref:hypothetical protein n=1 Tax=Candidatus Acidianus copahuensis TaxID=1160895 RepID=UPI00135F1946|nr:hypothetical protein [Candidatus Acidianus copahuensis]
MKSIYLNEGGIVCIKFDVLCEMGGPDALCIGDKKITIAEFKNNLDITHMKKGLSQIWKVIKSIKGYVGDKELRCYFVFNDSNPFFKEDEEIIRLETEIKYYSKYERKNINELDEPLRALLIQWQ